MHTGKRKRAPLSKQQQPDPLPPEPTCSICMQTYTRRTFLQPCFHSYCFLCIRQWINIVPQCPLCKQGIDSLIYNIDEEANTFQEYTLADNKVHNPPEEPPEMTLQDRVVMARRQLYQSRISSDKASYPPPQPRYAHIQLVTPELMPKAKIFVSREIPAVMGKSCDDFIERHINAVLLTPHESNMKATKKRSKTSMTMDDIVHELGEWLTIGSTNMDGDAVARKFLQELMAYLKSGLDYWTFVSSTAYDD
ncbi:hypothetical protein LRAMOSA07739 [Lichtheimia ramosa]|uniref:RING-type E3 ubiquitin transferase n=1 Tax=Lichtheimia ramosa TaxID=688394 RepID=A0A077WCR0_9FUNG|nr:hypothetical protein LRAMOSA07739 [Lichtheimia ramosa]